MRFYASTNHFGLGLWLDILRTSDNEIHGILVNITFTFIELEFDLYRRRP